MQELTSTHMCVSWPVPTRAPWAPSPEAIPLTVCVVTPPWKTARPREKGDAGRPAAGNAQELSWGSPFLE